MKYFYISFMCLTLLLILMLGCITSEILKDVSKDLNEQKNVEKQNTSNVSVMSPKDHYDSPPSLPSENVKVHSKKWGW